MIFQFVVAVVVVAGKRLVVNLMVFEDVCQNDCILRYVRMIAYIYIHDASFASYIETHVLSRI